MGCTPLTSRFIQIPPQYLSLFQQLTQINNLYNVNKKYEHLIKIQSKKRIGHRYLKTFGYHAIMTKLQMMLKRRQFWQTRITGEPEIWRLIKQIIQSTDESVSNKLINIKRIILLHNSIHLCIDDKLNYYEVPIFCINQPISYSKKKASQRNLNLQYQDQLIQITIRSTRYPSKDLKINESSSSNIQIVKQTLKGLTDQNRIRLFYNGRQMKQKISLGNYGYQPGNIIQALIY